MYIMVLVPPWVSLGQSGECGTQTCIEAEGEEQDNLKDSKRMTKWEGGIQITSHKKHSVKPREWLPTLR